MVPGAIVPFSHQLDQNEAFPSRHQSNMFLFIKRTLEFGYKEATFQQVEGLLRGSIKAALTLLGRPLL